VSFFNQGKPARIVSKGVICDVEDQVETLYTCPDNCRAEITMLYVVNADSAGSTDAVARWTRASDSAVFRLIGGRNLTRGEFLLLTGATLVLEPGDTITCVATKDTTPEMDFMCTVIETFIPVG
jgi:hypothetical protein